jgi:uncharacterized protein (TIGR00297 family)
MEFNQNVIWLLGVVILAFLAYRKQALKASGALLSGVIGGLIAFAFSFYGLLLLAAFFLSSTILGRVLQKKDLNREEFEEKGEKRDGKQVLANGGWASLAALLFLISENPAWFLAFVASLAAANSDTWASTIGKWSKHSPKMVITGKVVSPGQSGGTTLLGNIGALAGSTFIVLNAFFFQFLSDLDSIHWLIWLLLILVGVVSQWIDALAGAFIQALYYCDQCHFYTEKKHHCGKQSRLVKGTAWIDNDVVNHICTVSAFIAGGVIGVYVYF